MIKQLKKFMVTCMAVCMLINSTTSVFATETESGQEQSDYSQYAVEPSNLSAQGYDVVFCIDNSGSIWSQQSIRDNALRSIANLAVGSDIRIGGVYFGDTVCKTQGLTSMSDKDGSQQILSGFLNTTDQDPNNKATNIGNALEAAVGLFENQNVDRNRIVILFSDGINENEAGSAEYKTAADNKTAEQVEILESKGIPIYCVYLQKVRNDEKYLRNLVNYFNDENTYDNDRFKKVTDSEIASLSKQFAEIFYDMQNNMKYREISIDSTGKTHFYVPSVGIEKIQLYLNNQDKFEAVLENDENELGIKESWSDGNSAYVSLEDPATGEWTLSITGDNANATRGTIAYYADIMAYTEILKDGISVTELKKNDAVQAVVHFYDEEGNKIAIDPAVQVEAQLVYLDENGEESSYELSMKNEDGLCISDEFTIQSYGAHKVNIRVIYDDFLDLEYETTLMEISKSAPDTYKQTGTFFSEKTDNGQVFTFKADELYCDPEGEEVYIVELNQMNKSNPVTFEQKGDVISVCAEKMGDVKFSLHIQDSSGLTASVDIEGMVINKMMIELIIAGIVLIIVVVALAVVGRKTKSKEMKEDIGKRKTLLSNELDNLSKAYEKQSKNIKDMFEEKEYFLAMNSVRDIANNLSTKEKKAYDLAKFMEDPKKTSAFISWKEATSAIYRSEKEVKDMQEEADAIPTDIADKKVLRRIEQYEKKEIEYENTLQKYAEQCRIAADELEEYIGDAGEVYVGIKRMLETPITCDLFVQWGDFMGAQQGKHLKGSYEFDDIMISGPNGIKVFRDMFSTQLTNITVYGYQGPNGKEGLEFRRSEPFDIKKDGEDVNETVNKAILLKNERYCIILPHHGRMYIKVK